MNNIENAYTDLNNLISINADEIRTQNLYVDGILILPSSTNFNNINCQTLTCQTDLSSNTLYATVSIQGIPVARFSYFDPTSSIQGQFNNITTNYVSNSSLTTTLANYVSLASAQTISGVKTFTGITKTTNDLYFPDTAKSIYFTPNSLPPTTGNTTYLRITALGTHSYIDYGNGNLYFRQANAATGNLNYYGVTFSNTGNIACNSLTTPYISSVSFIDFRNIITPSTNFLINNDTIPLLGVIGLQTALDSKLSTTTAASTYLTISNANSTYATIASLANYLTTANAASTYLSIVDASNNYVKNTTLTSTLSNYVLTSYLTGNYTTTTALNTLLSNYLTISSATSTYLTQTDASNNYVKITDASNNYVTLGTTQTISGQKSFTNLIKNTSGYYFSADGATTSSIYCTPNALPATTGNTAYMRQFSATSTGNCYYDYAGSLLFRQANAATGNVSGTPITFSNTGSITSSALYTGSIGSFSYIDFRNIISPSTNMLFNNNMINKSVIIDLVSDLTIINAALSSHGTRLTDLETRATADEVVIAANSVAITALTATTVTHTGQITALTTSVGILQGETAALDGRCTTLEAKTLYQNVLSNFTQFSGSGLKIMNGLVYSAVVNNNGTSSWYGEMNIYNNLVVSGTAANGSISTSNISASTITANTTLSSGGTLSVSGGTTLNATTLTTGNLVISSGNLTISGLGTFNNGLISTELKSNSINYKDAVINIGNTTNLYTTGGSALSFNTLNIGNITTNNNIYGVSTFYGLTYFAAPSFNVTGWINQLN